MALPKPVVEPVTSEVLPDFARFLEQHMGHPRTAQGWMEGLSANWTENRPNYGFVLRAEGRIVGGIGALYADRMIRGKQERFCNITSWCVLEEYRKFSMQLAMAVTAQPGFHFTDFSPTKVVAGTLQFLKFSPLDEAVVVMASLPGARGHGHLVTDPAEIARLIPESLATNWREHAHYPWLVSALLGESGDWCHVIYRIERFKGLACARFVYISDSVALERHLGVLRRALFWKGIFSLHIERRWLSRIPSLARVRSGFNPKQYRSDTLQPGDIDYLFSETVALDLS